MDRLRQVQVGALRVSFVPDGAVKMVPRFLFPGTSETDWADNARFLDDAGRLTISSGALLVEHGDRAVLIDAGYGPYPEPVSRMEYGIAEMYGGALLDNLRRLGREPRDIEAIAITHLHIEHVGWAAHPAFAHAPCLLSDTEWSGRAATPGVSEQVLTAIGQRFRPVSAAEPILPGVTALALPGHTPGQTGYLLTSGDARLLAFADVMHSAVQVSHPDWPLLGESSPEESAAVRRQVLRRLADERAIGFGIHFADVTFGTVRQTGDAFSWEPLP
ncbi:MBL fold metallo-hydrolase [Dactylosporangium sp. CA-092794]|uniref:MBL fold metallo-hydrolase n=1 Tax=Dactylosporangium sp. CA-092794 TaxID=3239929 RepID=UPI003D8C14CF